MTQGVSNNSASSQCYCGTTQTTPSNIQHQHYQLTTVFQNNQSNDRQSNIFVNIEIIANTLSNTFNSKKPQNNATQTPARTSTNTDITNGNTSPLTEENNEGLDEFILSLIEELLGTLEELFAGYDDDNIGTNNNNNNSTAISEDNSSNNASATLTPIINPLALLEGTENDSDISSFVNLDEMNQVEQKFAMQLYQLIEFMDDVGNNLEATSDARMSNIIGYLDQQLEEKRYQNRRTEMLLSLIKILERY